MTEDLAGYDQALAWFEAERPVLLAAIAEAAAAGLATHAWQICLALENFALIRGHWHDYARAQRTALSAAGQADDVTGQVHAHRGLALQAHGDRLSHHAEAITCYQRGLDLCHQNRDTHREADALLCLGDAVQAAGDQDAARSAWQQDLAISRTCTAPTPRKSAPGSSTPRLSTRRPQPKNPGKPAPRSARAQAKASGQHDPADRPYLSFRGLLEHLPRRRSRSGRAAADPPRSPRHWPPRARR